MSAPPRAPDPWLLGKLVCPLTRQPLHHDEAAGELVSDAAGLAYPIRDGVPVMLIEAARRIGTPAGAARVKGEPSEKESQS